MAVNSYRLKKERERLLFSALMVFSGTLFIIIISLIFNLFKFEDFTDYTGPVKITFGSPDSMVEDSLVSELPTKDVESEIIEPVEEYVEATEESIPVEEFIPDETVTPVETPIPEPIPEPKVIEKPKPIEPIVPPQPIIQKGRESGNSHETSYETSSSKIGRRAYFPISQYMPLPKTITTDLYALIEGDVTGMGEDQYNRSVIDRFYWKSSNILTLNSSIPLQSRPEVWAIIERAGYDVDNAEYKTVKKLKNVVIVFEINSNTNGRNSIKSATIESSSGDTDIDNAVLYGFKQSTYSNSTDESVKGRFKYTFSNP